MTTVIGFVVCNTAKERIPNTFSKSPSFGSTLATVSKHLQKMVASSSAINRVPLWRVENLKQGGNKQQKTYATFLFHCEHNNKNLWDRGGRQGKPAP